MVYLLLLVYVQEGPVISGRYVEIRGLQPGMGYGLKVRAVVANCINDLDNEVEEAAVVLPNAEGEDVVVLPNHVGEEECMVESEEKGVKMACKYRCKDGSCINRHVGTARFRTIKFLLKINNLQYLSP